ncbi:lipid-binding SYLF domain-containing protein [Parvibaculum sp.]|jgi:lipid-binding SYLF domain-containing protein|uniref:lipid-binding SYLF domain-containing protein n=1 Tax=Parvibaculum sp. TaxID=2024848 RepID=UPI000C3A2B20|nr:lipid-binding SYLF domain-containing protein [Parvibaculum sp.]MAM94726.1 twin-arginine translocation pathway signal protein [Parvibaculum sp.]HCX67255.1 twin-arginine translocation pathway signal protein [Rhodobiaceae bacterium]|tara:strand:+ start:38677 stop:39237 length:561 start_codon:yes stop_codon:yes gene_type:complete
MATTRRSFMGLALALAALVSIGTIDNAKAATAEDLNKEAELALDKLYRTNSVAKEISEKAEAILVFPSIVKAGLVFGGAYGEGVLMEDGVPKDYYNSVTGSWGLQAGAQSYGYAVFLMNDKAVDYLKESHGWEVGVGPTVVVVDEGVAKNLSTSTLKEDAYAFIFDQEGLMAGVSIEGTKISQIDR